MSQGTDPPSEQLKILRDFLQSQMPSTHPLLPTQMQTTNRTRDVSVRIAKPRYLLLGLSYSFAGRTEAVNCILNVLGTNFSWQPFHFFRQESSAASIVDYSFFFFKKKFSHLITSRKYICDTHLGHSDSPKQPNTLCYDRRQQTNWSEVRHVERRR
jgi:hypothetical protein